MIELPKYEVKQLPSRFISYPDGVRIFVQPYTAGQAINIELRERTESSTMDDILEGVIIEGMDKKDLTPQDILFLGVYRNLVSSKHDKITIKSYCPKCLKENSEIKSLADIKFKEIEGFDDECYPIEVDFDKYIMHFEFVSYKAFLFNLSKFRGNKLYQIASQVCDCTIKETGEKLERPEYNFDSTQRQSSKHYVNYLTNIRDILFDLVDEDKDALDEVLSILEDYGTKPIDVSCQDKHCKYKYSVGLNEEGVLVLPFRESKKSSGTRVKLRKNDIDKSGNLQEDQPQRN